ncbi:MAG: glycine cleavage system aminomethyltransferase GcvT [Candidatus Nezhaarchaeales archaeon]
MSGLRRTHLYPFHKEYGRLVEYAGFEMPLWFEGIVMEHMAVREAVGVFDVTHMGRSLVTGPEAAEFLDHVTTRAPSELNVLQGHYTVMCNQRGGIKDDLTVYRLSPHQYLVVYNASNRAKDYGWLAEQAKGFNVKVEDVSDEVPMLAVQGPKAQEVLQKLTSFDLGLVKRYHVSWIEIAGLKALIARSGYTGEDGFELMLWGIPLSSPEPAISFWRKLLEAGRDEGMKPCGLGARNTLRLEAGMCLYDHDLNEDTTPYEARLDFTVKLDKASFIGREALIEQRRRGLSKVRIGLKMVEPGIPRDGCEILKDGCRIGVVTSGTYSPLLKRGIAMGYVLPSYAEEGSMLEVNVRGRTLKAEVVKWPFYDTERYGWRRKQ